MEEKSGRYLFLWFCILMFGAGLPAPAQAQSYSFRYFTVNDGLPSNETYAIYQGKTGELYIGTEYGLVHYDGEYFDQVPFEDDRYSGSLVFEIKKDANQNIWIRTYRDGFFYLNNDTLRAYRGNTIINNIIEESYIDQFYIDSARQVWFTLGNTLDTIFKIDAKGQNLLKIPIKCERDSEVLQYVYPINATTFLTVRSRIGQSPKPNEGDVIPAGNGFGVIAPDGYGYMSLRRPGHYIDHPGEFWMSMRNIMLRWDKALHKMENYDLGEEIISVYEDNNGNILIGTRKGAYFYSVKSRKIQALFEDRLVSDICQDSEQGYWFTTTSGLIYMPSLEMFLLPKPDPENAYISAIAGSDSLLATAGTGKYLRVFSVGDHKVEFKGQFKRERFYPPKRILFNNKKLICEWMYFDIRSWYEYPLHPDPLGALLDLETAGDTILLGFKKGFALLDANNLSALIQTPVYEDLFCRAIYKSGQNIYLGTDRGVYIYNKKNGLKPCFPNTLKFSINDIQGTKSGTVLIATRAGGMYIINGDSILQFGMEEGLSSPFCTRILVESDSIFWIGTNRGLNRIHWDAEKGTISRVDNWYAEDGLASDKINDLAQAGNFLFALTDEGINYFDLNDITISRPKVRIEMVKASIKGRKAAVDTAIQLMPDERDIWFEFRVYGFKMRRNTQMMYTLSGNEQYLSQTGGQTILYRDLLPGEYKLEVKALSPNGLQIGRPMIYSIFIEPYFYETLTFKIIVGILLLSLIAGGIVLYLRRLESRRRRKWEFGNAQLEALNLQMNPHFLFNALNNIQYLSFSKDHKMLNRFVSGLSGLMRSILLLSKSSLIPLSTEIKNIEQYLELEVMRIEDETFSYEIFVDKELDLDREHIPPMLVQPLVENAIWHGLLPKTGQKFLKISFTKSNQGFAIEVLDNGLGINYKQENKTGGGISIKPSLGLDNIRRRLKLYESMGFGMARINIEDLGSRMNGSEGTKVSLNFVLSQKHITYNAA